MAVVAEITVPADSLMLGTILEEYPDAEIELERIVPLREPIAPLFWITGGDPDSIDDRLRECDACESVRRPIKTAEKTLFEVRWTDDVDGVIQTLVETSGNLLEASGVDDQWDLRLRFHTHNDLSAFNMALTESGTMVTLRHLYNPTAPSDESALTPDQRETLLLAYRRGYFEVPRRTNLHELAAELDVTDSALSQQLRRANSRLVEQALLSEDEV